MMIPRLATLSKTAAALAAGSAIALGALAVFPGNAEAKRPRLPEIRLSASNQVPVCVTPKRLTQYWHARNRSRKLRRLYKGIASYYQKHGESQRIRWDYAFYQMLIETNYLTYRAGSGRFGDVALKQYNFAGIGTTGGGVPGNRFPDISTGVLAQMQHLIAYSGEYQKNPVAPRTRLKQGEIIGLSRKLKRPVRFDDLAGRWAVDRRYANSIEWVARGFRKRFCTGRALQVAKAEARARRRKQQVLSAKVLAAKAVTAEKVRKSRIAAQALATNAITQGRTSQNAPGWDFRLKPPAALGASRLAAFASRPQQLRAVPRPTRASQCRVMTASYGGKKTLLIKAGNGQRITYTALRVLNGFESSLAASYIRAHAKGGKAIAEFASQNEALAKAFSLCPSG